MLQVGAARLIDPLSDLWGAFDFSREPNADWITKASGVVQGFLPQIVSSQQFSAFPACVPFVIRAQLNPASSCLPHLAITGDIKLHNRHSLLSDLRIPNADSSHLSDFDIVRHAYEKWGDDCPDHLLGEFAFALLDLRSERVLCCRDHLGLCPFYYWLNRLQFCVAGDPLAILAVPGVPKRLNHRKFATMAVAAGHESYHNETFHEGINALPAGASLLFSREGLQQWVYWKPGIRENLVPRRADEAFEMLRELLMESVRCRIPEKGPVAVYLSGGLDSSAVMSLASRCLEQSGRTLLGLSCVLPDDTRAAFGDERDFIDEFRYHPNVRIEYVTAPGRGPFDLIDTPAAFARTAVWNPTMYLHQALEEAAVSAGADSVLQGIAGELGPTCRADAYITEMLVKFRWLPMTRELMKLGAGEGINPLRYLASRVLDLLPAELARRRRGSKLFLAPGYQQFRAPSQYCFTERCIQQLNQLASIRNWTRRGGLGPVISLGQRLRICQPLIDKRVLEFCISAPASLKIRNGYRRYLIRGALDGMLPEKNLWRTSKTQFSPDYSVRFNAQLGKAREFVAAIGRTDPIRSVIDVERLTEALVPSPRQHRGTPAIARVPPTIYAICFLRQFAEYRP